LKEKAGGTKEMTTTLEEETSQTNTKTLSAKEIAKGRLPLENPPEPYLIISDFSVYDNLGKAINILAIKKKYRVVLFSEDGVYGYFIMEKKQQKD